MTRVDQTKVAPGSVKAAYALEFVKRDINRTSHQTPERTLRCGMKKNEFRISEVPPGSVLLMGDVAVLSVGGGFCATQAR